MLSGFKLTCFGALPLLLTWACAPDLDSLSAGYGSGGTTANGGTDSGSSGKGPVTSACENNKHDPNESDVDCGGTSDCEACGAGLHCSSNKDCQSNFCNDSLCVNPSCGDGVKDQDETAIDCGGTCAPQFACELDAACKVGQDCKSEYCKDSQCADHCKSGALEADETDKDCGGSCEKCDDRLRCKTASDCLSDICSNNKCVPPTCNDDVLNQDESDVDCGGVCATKDKPCDIAARCNSGADCESWVCSKSKCVSDIGIAENDVIDDFEDGDLILPAKGGRVGQWYQYGDGSGTVAEEINNKQPRLPLSKLVLRNTGKDFTGWGSGVGADLNNPGGMQSTKLVYDASAYAKVTFWARAEAPLMLTVVFPDGDTDAAGGVCKVCAPDDTSCVPGCDHHYVKAIQVDTEWKRYTVPFSDLKMPEPGGDPEPTAFDPSRLISIQFRMASGQSYELFIDDVAFVK